MPKLMRSVVWPALALAVLLGGSIISLSRSPQVLTQIHDVTHEYIQPITRSFSDVKFSAENDVRFSVTKYADREPRENGILTSISNPVENKRSSNTVSTDPVQMGYSGGDDHQSLSRTNFDKRKLDIVPPRTRRSASDAEGESACRK
jgi:hypothetical protein